VLAISGHKEIGTRVIATLEKHVVVRIICDIETTGRTNEMSAVPDALHQLEPQPSSDSQLMTGQNFLILLKDRFRDIQTSRLRGG
jgi:hypothetical protein